MLGFCWFDLWKNVSIIRTQNLCGIFIYPSSSTTPCFLPLFPRPCPPLRASHLTECRICISLLRGPRLLRRAERELLSRLAFWEILSCNVALRLSISANCALRVAYWSLRCCSSVCLASLARDRWRWDDALDDVFVCGGNVVTDAISLEVRSYCWNICRLTPLICCYVIWISFGFDLELEADFFSSLFGAEDGVGGYVVSWVRFEGKIEVSLYVVDEDTQILAVLRGTIEWSKIGPVWLRERNSIEYLRRKIYSYRSRMSSTAVIIHVIGDVLMLLACLPAARR